MSKISILGYMRTALGHIFLARLWEVFKRYIVTGTMAGELPILPITATKLALQFPLPVLTCLELEFNCQSGVWAIPSYRIPCRDTRTGQPIRNANIKATGSGRGDPLADDIYVSCDREGFMSVIMGIGY